MKKTAALLTILLFATTARAEDKLFWTLATGAQAATVFDLETTVRALNRCPTCYEANPFMKPFVSSKPAAYSAGLGLSAASIYGSLKLKKQGTKWWWVPLAGQIGMHTAFGLMNNRIR